MFRKKKLQKGKEKKKLQFQSYTYHPFHQTADHDEEKNK